uniref:Uncharacterized protein n=1 Tax=Rhizophora mucronata TaxID=61149 RepID=A0A2P2NII4_RHIMU
MDLIELIELRRSTIQARDTTMVLIILNFMAAMLKSRAKAFLLGSQMPAMVRLMRATRTASTPIMFVVHHPMVGRW